MRCSKCGEEAPTVRGSWRILHGRPYGCVCLVCHNARMRAWWKTERGRVKGILRTRRRKANFVLACVPWADTVEIAKVYAEARRRTLETGIEYVVDHVLPIGGELVSGLHVQQNLQVLTRGENAKKGNRFTVSLE